MTSFLLEGRVSHVATRIAAGTIVLLAIAGLAPGKQVLAQDFTSDLAEFSLEELLDVDVVYGASKFEQKVSEAPSSITVIRREDIERYGYRTLADVLASVRGFHTTSDRDYQYVGVRGFGRPGDYNTRLLLLIDGARVNDGIYGTAAIGAEMPLDLELIDRIEIIRGPGSSLYGTNAMFGVINIVTRPAESLVGGDLNGEVASYEGRRGRLQWGKSFGSGIDLVLGGSISECRGQDHFFSEFDSPETNYGVAEDSDRLDAHRLFGRASWKGMRLQLLRSSREKVLPTAPWETVFNDPRTQDADAYTMAGLSYAHPLGSAWDFKARADYLQYDYEGDYLYDYSEDDTPYLVVLEDYAHSRRWSGETQFVGTLSERHQSTFGVEVNYAPREGQRTCDVEDVYLDDTRKSTDWGAYVQHEYRPLDQVLVNLGLRYDHHEDFGSTTNPRVGLIFSPGKGSTFKVLYGTAFRAPNSYELYYHDGGFTTKPAINLAPEEITTYEASWDQYLGRSVFVTVSGFHYELTDLINLTTDPADDLLVFRNLDAAESRGIELEFRRAWVAGVTGRVSYGYQETTDRSTGEILSNAPKHLAKLNLTAPVGVRGPWLGLEIQYLGSRKTVRGGGVDDFVITNLTLTKRDLLGKVGVSASAYNLFDTRYYDPASEEHIQKMIRQDGRNFRLELGFRF